MAPQAQRTELPKKEIVILRYGHRTVRDCRVTSHCCLVGRAFGAKKILIEGEEDKSIIAMVSEVTTKWGGNFEVEFVKNWKKEFEKYKALGFKTIHLTMYGEPIQEKIQELRRFNKILVIIGSKKVEREVYKLSDYNIAITQQPHSEIAALAIALHEIFGGAELSFTFENAQIKLIANPHGKTVVRSTM